MSSGRGEWREIIMKNLEVLSKCTFVTSEMATFLLTHKLITQSQKDAMMNANITDHNRASELYTRIAAQWDDSAFETFKRALAEGANSRALDILKTTNFKRVEKEDFNSTGELAEASSASLKDAGVWILSTFEFSRATGVWYVIETYELDGRKTGAGSIVYNFIGPGNTIEGTKSSGGTLLSNYSYVVEAHSEQKWAVKNGGIHILWHMTDYNNWGILSENIYNAVPSRCNLCFLSRTPTLPARTLKMLRCVAAKSNYPNTYGMQT